MKIVRSIVVPVCASIALTAISARAESLSIGSKIPDATVKMKNVDGKDISIADVAGPKGTLVVFTCNHCPFAKAWQSRLVEIGNAYQAKGIGVIAINPNDPTSYEEDSFAVMQERVKQNGEQFPYVVDGTSNVARDFGATKTPEAFLFDKEGKLVYHGAIDDDKDASKVTKQYLHDALDELIGGQPVQMSETKSVGCGIKFRSKA
jgi:peroxiredoxin